VLLGRTQLPLRDVAQLGNGAVVELDCSPDDPVEIMVNDRVIAEGEVVVVSGNYGVRITKIAGRGESHEIETGPSDLFSLSEKLR
jgi:flagellar motor switch protein FliN/FliY